MALGRTTLYSPRAIFWSGITYSFQPVTKKFRTVFRPERRHSPHFRTTAYRKACHEKFRTVRAHKQKKKSRKNQIKRFFLLFCVYFFQKCYSQNPLPGISLRWQSFDILTLSHSQANLSDFWLFIFFNSLCQLIGAGSVFSPAEVSL